MIRATDGGDWTFGNSLANYKVEREEVSQNVNSRLRSYLGDCFFDLASGIDWFLILGTKDAAQVDLSVRNEILNTDNVLGINEFKMNLISRRLVLEYSINTSFGELSSVTTLDF